MASYNVRTMTIEETKELYDNFKVSNRELDIYDDEYSVTLYNKDKQELLIRFRESCLILNSTLHLSFVPNIENLRFDGKLKLTNDIINSMKNRIKHCNSTKAITYLKGV